MQHPQGDIKQPEMRQQMNLALNLANCLAKPWRDFCGIAATGGWREAQGINGAIGLGLLFLFGGLGQSHILLYVVLPVAVLSRIEYRLKAGRGNGVHSYAMPLSQFTRWTSAGKARMCEVLLAVGIGLLLYETDAAAGSWFIFSGGAHALVTAFVHAREQHLRADIADAQVEAEMRVASHDSDDRPWFGGSR